MTMASGSGVGVKLMVGEGRTGMAVGVGDMVAEGVLVGVGGAGVSDGRGVSVAGSVVRVKVAAGEKVETTAWVAVGVT
jgi:hypothetical protein